MDEKQRALELLTTNPLARRYYFKDKFFNYCNYYFREYYSFATPDVLKQYYDALATGKNVYFKGFR